MADAEAAAGEPFVHTLERTEWEQVMRRVRPFVRDDERDPQGHLVLLVGGGRRRWAGHDADRLAVWDAGPDGRHVTLLVSPRLLDAFPFVEGGTGEAQLVFEPRMDPPQLMLNGPGGDVAFDVVPLGDPPPTDLMLAERRIEDAGNATCTASSEQLRELVLQGRRAPAGPFLDDDRPEPVMWLHGREGSVGLVVGWEELGDVAYSMRVDGGGDCRVPVSPLGALTLFDALDPGDVELSLPPDADHGIWVRQDAFTAILMPDDPAGPLRARVEEVLTHVFGPDVVHRDDDGDYLLGTDGVPVWASLVEADPPQLRVFAHVLDGIDEDPELLSELNALNTSIGLAKLLWLDGVVMAFGGLVATTVDEAEVAALYERVRGVADGLGPTLAARFGGEPGIPGAARRWANYVRARLRAELVPGVWSPLNGPESAEHLPFDGPAYLISAHDPFGRRRPDHVNELAEHRLVGELLSAHAGFARAMVTGADGEAAVPGYLAWGLHVDSAVQIARAVGQEVLFGIEGDEVVVLGTGGERTELPRRGEG
ncbi:MAG: T3SS (YopN, CesT) and YbjN peptide-binding chaperone 1 [Microthrixaceae bacterium]